MRLGFSNHLRSSNWYTAHILVNGSLVPL